MLLKRREFIQLSLKSAVVIGAGSSLAFAGSGYQMPEKSNVKLRFALASDGHWGQPDTQYQAKHEEINTCLIKEKEGRGLDFVIVNGDIIDWDFGLMPEVRDQWRKLPVPVYANHGNHDVCTEEDWIKVWETPWHYVIDKGDNVILMLNTANVKGEYICPDLDWTRGQLEKYKDVKNLFAVMHITPVKWTYNGISCPELVDLFSAQANLKAIFHGHDHDHDNFMLSGGKPYFFDGHTAGGWGLPYRGYRMVEVLEDGKIITSQMNVETGNMVNQNKL